MPASTRLIRRRIKSVENTKKITKAMEMVAASKMRKSVSAVLGTRPYSELSWQIVSTLAKSLNIDKHPLLRKSVKAEKVLILLIASDRGLAGSYNTQVTRKLIEMLKDEPFRNAQKIDFITIGKKAELFIKKLKFNGEFVATFINLSNNPTSLDTRPISGMMISAFLTEKYDAIYVVYTDYYSAIRQAPSIKQLLPMDKSSDDKKLGKIGEKDLRVINYDLAGDYLFEPNSREVLDLMLPRILETQVFQAVLESNASEHSARMMAMRNATDAAGEMMSDLTLSFNQLRQANITRELAEIVSGKAAVE